MARSKAIWSGKVEGVGSILNPTGKGYQVTIRATVRDRDVYLYLSPEEAKSRAESLMEYAERTAAYNALREEQEAQRVRRVTMGLGDQDIA